MEDSLNEQQRKAVEFSGKHLLVMAGAGTGKTHTIIARAKHLIQQGVPAHRILILSFTRKSAKEIVERTKLEVGSGVPIDGLKGQTFHSWCMDIIKNNPKVFATHAFSLLDEEDRSSCIKLICGKGVKDKENHIVKPDSVLDIYSYAMNACCSLSAAMRMKLFCNASETDPDVSRSIELNKPVYEELIRKYIGYKKERQYMDYDDILSIVAKGLSSNTEARNFIASKYDHILVDEMQDTNPLQYKLLSSFYDKCHLFCVGDDAQSIYAFRGADFKTMHRFTEIVPNAERQDLTINYRSTQGLLNLSNWILKTSPLDYRKELISARGEGAKPVFVTCKDEWDEARSVANKILKSIQEKGLKYADNMVLSRSLYGLRTIESQCISQKIPYIIYGGISLMQSKHVRDLVAPMRIVANHKDELAWMRYLLLWKGIGEVSASKIISHVMDAQTIDECLDKLQECNVQDEILLTLRNLRKLLFSPSTAITKALETMEKRLEEIYKEEWQWRKKDFDILKEVARETSGILEFVSEYVLDPKLETTIKQGESGEEDVCILSTIHSAKGLEASICYLLKASPSNFPTPRAIENGQDSVEEERRCLYVALTRAKDELYIYRNVHSHQVDTQSDDPAESRYFFNALPDEIIEKETTSVMSEKDLEEFRGNAVGTDILGEFDFG